MRMENDNPLDGIYVDGPAFYEYLYEKYPNFTSEDKLQQHMLNDEKFLSYYLYKEIYSENEEEGGEKALMVIESPNTEIKKAVQDLLKIYKMMREKNMISKDADIKAITDKIIKKPTSHLLETLFKKLSNHLNMNELGRFHPDKINGVVNKTTQQELYDEYTSLYNDYMSLLLTLKESKLKLEKEVENSISLKCFKQ